MAELEKFIGQRNILPELEAAFEEIFVSEEATAEEKRLRRGKFGRLFKLTAEELLPLVIWMKVRCPEATARIIDGNQNYDAEVWLVPDGPPLRIEIGSGGYGHQWRLHNEFLTQHGVTCPFNEYERTGKGSNKSVQIKKKKGAKWASDIASDFLQNLNEISATKSKKRYSPDTYLVLFVENSIPLAEKELSDLKERAQKALSERKWAVFGVDVVCKMNGLIANWGESPFDDKQ